MSKIIPLANRVVLLRDKPEEKTSSGIILSEVSKEVQIKGTVQAVGDTVTRVKEGDRVLFTRFSGSDMKIDGQELLMLREEDILAKLVEA